MTSLNRACMFASHKPQKLVLGIDPDAIRTDQGAVSFLDTNSLSFFESKVKEIKGKFGKKGVKYVRNCRTRLRVFWIKP